MHAAGCNQWFIAVFASHYLCKRLTKEPKQLAKGTVEDHTSLKRLCILLRSYLLLFAKAARALS